MSNYEKELKQKLEDHREPVDASHVEAFRKFLLDEKRRRRRAIYWIIPVGFLLLSMLTAGVYTWYVAATPQYEQETIDDKSATVSGMQEGASFAEDRHAEKDLNTAAGVESTARSSLNVSSLTHQELRSGPVNLPGPDPAGVAIQHPAPLNKSASTSRIDEKFVAGQHSDRQAQPGRQGQSEALQLPRTRHPAPASLSESVISALSSDHLEVEVNGIEPVLARPARLTFGIAGSWFMAQPEKSAVGGTAGTGYQGGVFAQYRISPRVRLALEGGLLYINDGVLYNKESVVTTLAFRARSSTNRLRTDEIYAWYAGGGVLYDFGLHAVELGVQAYHVYGAKGDLERLTGSEPDQMEMLHDTWVVVSGLRSVPIDLILGYRIKIVRHLEAGLYARIPVLHFGPSESFDGQFVHTGYGYGISPQVKLFYRIN